MNPMMVAQGEGFIRRYIELDIEEGRPGAEQALEWWAIVETALTEYRKNIYELENKFSKAKQVLG